MKTVTFELEIPITTSPTQWTQFIYAINAEVELRPYNETVPFAGPLLQRYTEGVGVEVYNEAIIFYTDTQDRRAIHEYTAYIRFEATSPKMCRLFRDVAREFSEAKPNAGLNISGAFQWYAYQRLRADALRLQIKARGDLEVARPLGD